MKRPDPFLRLPAPLIRHIFGAVFLFITGLPCGFGQTGYRIAESIFLPPKFYVGDLVELRLKLELDPGYEIEAIREIFETE